MRHKKRIGVLALGLSAALLLCSCGESGDRSSSSPSPSETASESVPPEDAPKDYSKYNSYLHLSEKLSEMVDILDVYFMQVEYAPEFALAEGGDYALIKDAVDFYIGNTYKLEEALDYSDEDPAYTRLDAAVRALGDSPVKLMEAIEDLSNYMQFDGYQEDNLAKAPEIHAAIWEPLQIVSTYYNEFMNAMDELAAETRGEDLEDLKDEDMMILYYSSIMIYSSQDIQSHIWDKLEAANMDSEEEFVLPEIDMTELSPLFDDFNKAYEELTKAMADEEQQAKVFTGPVAESAMKLYTNKVDSLYSWAGRLAKTLTEGGDYYDDFFSMSDAISSMIDGYNSLT